ncbi:hypothetical protein BEL04_03465 [Mucilaginibacter sp. PPCGB 2223]|uniref:hypothetical protein n=1 Tax=Mucilaginibacter sp. PPCGB 2223 TaxID=1886027 RepID=UPI0008255616|nr:hypothetical protein [Mucilaginibacter sp. PPCGB 2223]OCX53372.1 hypothetical protein BEL04_03465 [Mucilaginibacter sp. PPCGB 2223]
MDKVIYSYPVNDVSTFDATVAPTITPMPRVDGVDGTDYTFHPSGDDDPNKDPDGGQVRKPHHISEITVTDDGGKRMVYGIPVYNLQQDEYSFTVGSSYTVNNKNQVRVANTTTGKIAHRNNGSVDDYYHRETKPPYATSYLLTAILSPDYVDKTNNGISDDDLGTAIKFNYSKMAYATPYAWRTPYQESTLNKGLLADPDDDKASIVRGTKEIWYVHSIETKTKIAYFITEERSDALGAKDGDGTDPTNDWTHGGANPNNKLRCLKEIRLYSKADKTKPIKVVKFDYAYTLCTGIPNSLDFGSASTTNPLHAGGKLTLTKVWFEYANISKGQYHPYKFSYNTTANGVTPTYDNLVTDRWGVYKNRSENIKNLENDEFPYTDQNKSIVDQNAALWHLSTIELPTGGTINVSYESDDYAYVQNRRAMVMSDFDLENISNPASVDPSTKYSLLSSSSDTYLRDAQVIRVAVSTSPPIGTVDATPWFEKNYLDGSDYIYTKLRVKVSTPNDAEAGDQYDFVPCYAHIDRVMVGGGYAHLEMHSLSTGGVSANPIIMAAWQHMKNEYPRYAYPGFENARHGVGGSLLGAISATVAAAKNLSELLKNFYQKAYSNKYAAQVQKDKSFVRLTKNNGPKLGGGVRVKKIRIFDNWQGMQGGDTRVTAGAYGQAYDYTTTENNQTISSGVATYEPSIGNDENPFKQPVEYAQEAPGALTNYLHIEEPFAESLFPAPAVTYSKVTVTDLDQSGEADPAKNSGTVINEFYTTKDFPVKVNVLPLYPVHNQPQNYFSFITTTKEEDLCMSQGYSIELNDMNAKVKSVRVLDKSGSEISSTTYNYLINGNTGGIGNQVTVITPDNIVHPNVTFGQDVEFFTDFRQQDSDNTGLNVNVGFDFAGFGFFGVFAPHFPVSTNDDVKLFRSACALKVIQSYGIVSSVVKHQNGSSITTRNIAFDSLTGDPVVTSTQNEFNNDIYSLNIPAYWAYKRMGGAYKNLGVLLDNVTTTSTGGFTNYSTFLQPGDELDDVTPTSTTSHRYWVSSTPAGLKLIDADGHIQPSTTIALAKVVRSGYRNDLSSSAGSIVSLSNPIQGTHLQIGAGGDLTSTLKAINASATVYDEKWAVNKECTPAEDTRTIVTHSSPGNLQLAPDNGSFGTYIQLTPGGSTTLHQSTFWGGADCSTGATRSVGDDASHFNCGLSYRSGISLPSPYDYYGFYTDPGYNQGFETCISIPATQTYYFGFTSYGAATIYVDGSPVAGVPLTGASQNYSHVVPVALTAGSHVLRMESQVWDAPAQFGLEIYKNTASEIASTSSINTIFTTASLPGASNVQDFGSLAGVYQYHYTYADGTTPNVCDLGTVSSFTAKIVNPYVEGYLGNWRPYQTLVYQQSRVYNKLFDATNNRLDIPNAGYINSFYSFWKYGVDVSGQPGWVPDASGNAASWVTANTVTLYDKYGQQLENKDALGRFSAAKFDFNGELPGAVASNAMNREIYSSSFEDNAFTLDTGCHSREFLNTLTGLSIQRMKSNTVAHSGFYSAALPTDGVTLSTMVHSVAQKTQNYLDFDSNNQYITRNVLGLYPNGFEPAPLKKYIFNAWVNDGDATQKSVSSSLEFRVNGNLVTTTCKAIVEDWKLIEATIDLTSASAGGALTISLKPTGTVYIDDIRIHPFDAHMKSYAYDYRNMRLMAEMDENSFATFYEYDNEGLLVRVKKETERGVMTLKESRSSYKKIN